MENIYLLERLDGRDYDTMNSVVVVAEDESSARDQAKYAEPNSYRAYHWLSAETSACTLVGVAVESFQSQGDWIIREVSWG